MQTHETLKTLPEECIIASYDCKACATDKIPIISGSIMSIGAVLAKWSRTGHPFDVGPQAYYFEKMTPEVPITADSLAFWSKHIKAMEWSTENDFPIHLAFWNFANWIVQLSKKQNFPVVLLAAPHDYDFQHIKDGLNRIALENVAVRFWEVAHFADSAELYATKHNLPLKEGKTEFKNLFMPKNLVHEPVLDSMVQLSATIAGLLYQRPAGPPVTGA